MGKVDYKKAFKEYYLPPTKPVLIDVPAATFATISGKGNPGSQEFQDAVGALYSVSYTIKMLPKKGIVPDGYYDYTVFPLEGIWDMDVSGVETFTGLDKDKFLWTIMIRQPEFVTDELFERVRAEAAKKKDAPKLDNVRLERIGDGLSVQMMHSGPYDDEPASFALMDRFCSESGLRRIGHKHREIYMSDPRRTAPEKMKTVLRYFVSR